MSDEKKWTGVLDLDIENRLGKSIAKRIYHKGGIKLQRPIYLDGGNTPCFYLLNPHGAFFDGDLYHMKIRVRENARLTLTTQGASKVHRVEEKEAYQETEIYLDKNSYFEYLPDSFIAFKDSKYHQNTKIYLQKGANLLYLEILTPGWSPDQKPFTYNQLRFKSEIYLEEELVVYDHIKFEPGNQKMEVMGFMENYSHLGTFMVIGEQVTEELIKEIHQLISKSKHDISFGISELIIPGFTVRIKANMTQHIEWIAMECRNYINKKWYGTALGSLRKY